MRVLFVTPPGYGHAFPLIPLAWAFRLAGHTVAVATTGVSLGVAARAGLAAINVAVEADLPSVFRHYSNSYRQAFHDPDKPLSDSLDGGPTVFTALADVMTEGLIDCARHWRPNLIIHTPYAAAAPIVATALGIPTIFLGIAIAYTPRAMLEGTYARMRQTWKKFGIEKLEEPRAWIDVAPPSLRRSRSDGVPMRYISYHGAGITENAEHLRYSRPRVIITLGTVVPLIEGLGLIERIISQAAHIPADFTILHGSPEGKLLRCLPNNITATSWLPLDQVLNGSNAIVHHGGPGTMFAALNACVPQIVLPRASDQFYNADALQRFGAAIVHTEGPPTVESLELAINDSILRVHAEQLRDEMEAMHNPSELIPMLEQLATGS
jgi:UDP:flavonoid glycosyltransferase YjiC (YdhE family)